MLAQGHSVPRTSVDLPAVSDFLYSEDTPLAAEHAVINAVLVEAGAEPGRPHSECHGADYRFAHTIVTRKVVDWDCCRSVHRSPSGTSG